VYYYENVAIAPEGLRHILNKNYEKCHFLGQLEKNDFLKIKIKLYKFVLDYYGNV